MSALQVTFDGRNYTFAPGTIVRVGRSSENEIVVNDPAVSRRHAQLSWEAAGWVWQNSGQAPTFLAGQSRSSRSDSRSTCAWPRRRARRCTWSQRPRRDLAR
jgi:pSer/pThr/pTyr-binding forkhead associated (FHA) protein